MMKLVSKKNGVNVCRVWTVCIVIKNHEHTFISHIRTKIFPHVQSSTRKLEKSVISDRDGTKATEAVGQVF